MMGGAESMAAKEGRGRSFSRRWAIVLVSGGFILGLLGMTAYVLHLEAKLVRSMAVRDALLYSKSLEEFRTLYTAEVVERVRGRGVQVSHDYREHPGAIPLPATLSMLLGKRIFPPHAGSVRLFSDYPFPWRAKTGGPQDDFEREALRALRDNPSEPFLRFETQSGDLTLRYATADLMRESCVDCHNSHPDTPKRGWKVGDVRGVLSVSRPIGQGAGTIRGSLRGVVALLAGFAVFALAVMAWVAVRLRRAQIVYQQLAYDTAAVNRELVSEIEQRERVEAERRKLEEQVRHSQKLEGLGVLAGGIAHDFNNLLMGVLGNAELARSKVAEGAAARQHIELIETAAMRARELTRELLAYAGHSPVKRRGVDLTALIRETNSLLLTAVEQAATVELELLDGLPNVKGDRSQLQQVLMNLITNAADAVAHEDGRIWIRTELTVLSVDGGSEDFFGVGPAPGRYVVLEVRDNGEGMDEETRRHMFDPFFTTKATGSGLGLAALQGIVRAHAGGLSVRSVVGEGTVVRVLLPCIAGKAAANSDPPEMSGAEVERGTVLVVDDQDVVRLTVTLLLKDAGFDVIGAASGREALQIVTDSDVDISAVLLDQRMPGMDGEETLRQLREIEPSLRVVISSGQAAEGAMRQFITEGSVGFLQKPYTEKELLMQLGRTCASNVGASHSGPDGDTS